MDTWKYYGITHRHHLVCNPMSEEKLDELVGLFRLGREARVLDVACGKAELLCRIAERWGAGGTGVDLSPYEVRAARERIEARGLGDRLVVVEGDGAAFEAEEGAFDLGMCIGATWVWSGHRGTLRALARLVGPGGLVAVGEPFKLREPSPEHAELEPELIRSLVPHHENVAIGESEGLTPLYALVSSPDDWDRYEGLQGYSAETYAAEHPDDPDLPELLERQRRERGLYLRWRRDTLGWAIYLFRR